MVMTINLLRLRTDHGDKEAYLSFLYPGDDVEGSVASGAARLPAEFRICVYLCVTATCEREPVRRVESGVSGELKSWVFVIGLPTADNGLVSGPWPVVRR